MKNCSYSINGHYSNNIIEGYDEISDVSQEAPPTNVSIFNLKVGDVGNGSQWPSIAHEDRANPNDYAFTQNMDGTTVLNASADKSLHFRLGNEDKMIIKNNNVGIGISNPQTKLHVDGSITANDFIDKDGIINANKKLCIGETCVDEKQLLSLLNSNSKVDNNTTIGRLHMGEVGHGPAWQGIANKKNVNKTDYALIQHNNGSTIINSKAGQNLHFRQGNVDRMIIDKNGNTRIDGVHIGDVGHGGAWQGIANKKNVNKTDYALIQHNNGSTIINSKAGQNLHFRQGNKDKIIIDKNGDVDIRGKINARNDMNMSGNVNIKGKLCIGNTCLTEDNVIKLINMTIENKLFSTNNGIGDFKFDAINAKYIRIYPQSWNKHMSLRFDVYVDNKIQSNNENTRTYSSIWGNNAIGTGHARSMLNSVQGWSAAKNSIGEWAQINVGSNKSINGIKILKRTSHDQYIKTFYIKYSTDNVVWNYIK